jgi:hypothetical protein
MYAGGIGLEIFGASIVRALGWLKSGVGQRGTAEWRGSGRAGPQCWGFGFGVGSGFGFGVGVGGRVRGSGSGSGSGSGFGVGVRSSGFGAVLILSASIFFFALDSDPRAFSSHSAARPIFGAPVALFGAWLSFRKRE